MISQVRHARHFGSHSLLASHVVQSLRASCTRHYTSPSENRRKGHQAGSFHIRGEVSKMGLFRCENTVKAVVRLRCTDEGKSYTVTIWDDAAVEAFTEVKLDDVLKVIGTFKETGETFDETPAYCLHAQKWEFDDQKEPENDRSSDCAAETAASREQTKQQTHRRKMSSKSASSNHASSD